MTYNLKSKHNSVLMGAFTSTTRITVSSGSLFTNAIYSFTSQDVATGMQATISSGSISLGDKIYHGVFYPMVAAADALTMSVFINGVQLDAQATVSKALNNLVSSTASPTRAIPIFFSYSATAGDILSIRYSKTTTSDSMILYENSIGGNVLFLLEVQK